jgi:hypothetical protein
MSATATRESQAATTTEEPPVENSAGTVDPAAGCPKCGNLDSWGTASWCPKCGYYPRLGTTVSGNPDTDGAAETTASPSSYMEALARLPQWSYFLAAGVVAIFVVSLAVRVITPDDSFSRSLWSVTQLFVGGGTFAAVHFYAFLRAGMKTSGLNAFDVIVHPIEVWRPSFRELPATARRIYAGAWGFTAALCAVVIIGGVRYSALTDDWGFKERPKQNLVKKIKDQMRAAEEENAEDADNLDDAINDRSGDDAKKNEEHELEMLSADCVVIGYNIDSESGAVKELVLASLVDEKLQYVGTVSAGISEEVQGDLKSRLPKLTQEQPLLKCPVSAIWVKPVVTCRTSFKSWSDSKRMQQPEFKELLADTDVK